MAFSRIGFGQVEENQLSYYHTGQMFASLPLDPEVQVLQNGEFMYYNYAARLADGSGNGFVKAEGKGEPMLVLNEIKIYEDYLANKDFAMVRVGDNYTTNPAAIGRITSAPVDGKSTYKDGSLTIGINADPAHTEYGYRMDGIAPRLVKTNIGDIYTTNMVATGNDVVYNVGDVLAPAVTETKVIKYLADGTTAEVTQKTLVLTKTEEETGMLWQVVKVYTMPDGQPGLKLQRIQ